MEKQKIKVVIDDYKRRVKTINDMLTSKENRKEPNLTRLRTKWGCYNTFIVELERLL